MALEIKQSLKLSQQLVMTPQLQQAIKLLQLNRMELVEVINQELTENPLLEEVAETVDNPDGLEQAEAADAAAEPPAETESAPAPEATSTTQNKDDVDWEQYIEDVNNNQSALPAVRLNTEDLPSFENILTKTTTLTDHLLWQLSLAQMADEERRFGELVIGNLNDEGYLIAQVEDLAKEANMETEDALEVLKIMQKFDPVGVCSRDLQECLMAQAQFLQPRNEMVEKIIQVHLPDLERKNYQSVAKALGVSLEDVITATKVILELEPKPGRSFVTMDNTQYITPDIYVYLVANEYVIMLNEDGMPKLRVSSYYKNVLSGAKQGGGSAEGKKEGAITKEYIQDKLRSAVWLIRSIHNRQKTIYKVTESIVKHQKDFFEKGVGFLKPMILKDVAADIGMHESTVSRVTTNKFVHTPVGIFELKYFFNSGISASDGGTDVASEAVKEKIRQMLSKEDPTKPLSDQRIVELLHAENIDIARRTVAKYRDMLGILSSSKRKKLF